ncbi:MucBP domain-containing protein, partial [Staphylococcus cohnii]
MKIFKQHEQKQRFSIKKYHFGAVSVLIGAILFVGTTNDVSAAEIDGKPSLTVDSATIDSKAAPEASENQGDVSKAEKVSSKSALETSENQTDASKPEHTSSKETPEAIENQIDTPKVENVNTKGITEATENQVNVSKSENTSSKEIPEISENQKDTSRLENVPSKEVLKTTESQKDVSTVERISSNMEPKSIKKRDISESYDSNSMFRRADESLSQPPAEGYSVNSDLPTNNKVTHKIHKATDPKQYTFEVARRGKSGDKQYVFSVRKEDVDHVGAPTKFFVTVFDKDKVTLIKEIDIKTITPSDIQLDEVTFLNIVAKKNGFSYRLNKIDGNEPSNFLPIYGSSAQLVTGEVVSYSIVLPHWKGQTTYYYDEQGREIAPPYTQYGWTKSAYTTEPPEIDGYALDSTRAPLNQNGKINKQSSKIVGNVRYSKATTSRGTMYRKDKILDNKSTVESEVWFTYAKAPDTFDPVNGSSVDKGRIAANNLPDMNYDFEKNPNGYEFREKIVGGESEGRYQQLGLEGKVIFQKFRFQKNGLPSNVAISVSDYDGGDATSSSIVRLKKGEVTNSRYDNGRTFDISNNFEYPDTVEYYYITKKGDVVVAYVDTEGNELKASVEDVKDGLAGTDYDTVIDNRPVTIEKNGKIYKLVSAGTYTIGKVDDQGHLTTSDAPIGKIQVGTKTVTYVYEEVKQGNVVIDYLDEAGNPIKESVEDTPNSNVDTAYDTTDHKPKFIEKDGKKYFFSKVKEGDHETGKVVEGTTSVTYIYKELGKYIPHIPENPGDTYDPNKPGTEQPPVGYDETPEEPSDNPPLPYIPGYTPKDPSGNPLIPVDPDHPERGYIPPSITDPKDPSKDTPVPYEKDPTPEVKQGNVVVNYVDEAGNPIKESVEDTSNSNVDTVYDTTDHKPKVIGKDGKLYLFSKVKEGDHETGKVVEGTTSVTYIYKELGKYIPYIPEKPGDAYDPNKPGTNRPPVMYDETPEEPSDNPPLPYIPGYTPKDPSGNPLIPVDPDHPERGYIPPSITDPKDPSKDTPVPYEKDPTPEVKQGNVVVNYVDEAGNPIKESVEDTSNSNIDTAYDTTDNKPKFIKKDGKKYFFTKVKEGDHETGKVVEGTTSVTYIYKELGKYIPHIPEKAGDTYDPSKPGTEQPPVGYDETPEEPSDNPPLPYIPGYTPKDPSGNPLVPVDPDHPERGYIPPSITDPKDPSKDTPVPYEKDPTPEVKQGNVVVNYVDEAGNPIKESVEDTSNSNIDTAY